MSRDRIRADVVVIGAGPAGIAAATAAARHGRSVIIVDDNPAPGGQIWREATGPQRARSQHLPRQRALDALRASGAQVLSGRSVFDVDAGGRLLASCGPVNEVEEFRFEQLILATGARERLLPFSGWTLQGVFGAGGLQALAKGGYPVAGKRIVVAGTGPLLLAVAKHLAEDGATISCVVEQAPLARLVSFAASLWSQPQKLFEAARYRPRAPYRTGCWVSEAMAHERTHLLSGVRITDGAQNWTERCDLLACGYHLIPNTEIAELLGCEFRGKFVAVDELQRTSVSNVFCAGEPTGIGGLEAALVQGEIAGLACAGKGHASAAGRAAGARRFAERLEITFALRPELRGLPSADTIVCRCEDVRFGSLEGRAGWTDAKLQTRCGMGPCQGRVCGPAIEFLKGWRPASVRQPLLPVAMEALCGAKTVNGFKAKQQIEERV